MGLWNEACFKKKVPKHSQKHWGGTDTPPRALSPPCFFSECRPGKLLVVTLVIDPAGDRLGFYFLKQKQVASSPIQPKVELQI